jgi:tetratricopeptide (TPR) repeat protein
MNTRTMLAVCAFTVALSTLAPTTGQACYWDKDTLAMERRAFPKLLALIVGRVRTRSVALYRRRVKDRLAKLKKTPKSLRLLDDLAVAYDKLGRHDEAIATATRALALAPKRYETLANLGTFHFHRRRAADKDLARGVAFIERALKINPKAHFGRERYQLWLVKYLISRGKAFSKLPLAYRTRGPRDSYHEGMTFLLGEKSSFRAYLARQLAVGAAPGKRRRRPVLLDRKAQKAAIKGLAGMLRFGNNDSPILLEALVSLLLNGRFRHRENHTQLAVFALWRAAEHPKLKPASREAYLRLGRSLARTTRRYEHHPERLYRAYQRRRRPPNAGVHARPQPGGAGDQGWLGP